MSTNFSLLEEAMIEGLCYDDTTRFTVRVFCEKAQMPRATFYRNFTNMTGLYQYYCNYSFYRLLRVNDNLNFVENYHRLLEFLEERRELICQIYLNTPEFFFQQTMEEVLLAGLQSYYRDLDLSNYVLKLIARTIAFDAWVWINSGFTDELEQIYAEFEKVLATVSQYTNSIYE